MSVAILMDDLHEHYRAGLRHIVGQVEGSWTCRQGPKHVGMHWHASEHAQTVVGGLGKIVVCGYMWVWVGACWHSQAHVGEVLV